MFLIMSTIKFSYLMNSFSCLLLVLSVSLVTGVDVCSSNYCTINKCPQEITDCPEGYLLLTNSTTCGCCNLCVKIGDLDENCVKTSYQNIPAIICGEQLVCSDNQPLAKCVQGKSDCLTKRIKALEINTNGNNLNYITNCDYFGDYFNFQCFNSRCFCVDGNGNKIFGDFLETQKSSVNCACSRDLNSISSMLNNQGQLKIPSGSPQCQSNGNYLSLQLTNTHGYCIDSTSNHGRAIKGVPVTINNIKKLPCYNQKTSDFPCWSELTRKTNQLTNLKKTFDYVVGYELPDCDLDGTFKAKQCDKTSCFCVNKKGEKFGSQVTISRDSPDIEKIKYCIRDKDMLRKVNDKNWTNYNCDHLGNYNPIQCLDGQCFCVDFNGLPIDNQRYNQSLVETINCSS
ncbi:uncharacterized protein LOC128393839 isoform X2 [Panonychus citri]|uniref:uncharacterized protein LOC128393839 isoform X2 n=1 Tax=Panonychus citri TaxID=50023 RepID=UPI002307574A|nr:uncharacterized protein LOC128393839 isoform X2 [Panonychus citri]